MPFLLRLSASVLSCDNNFKYLLLWTYPGTYFLSGVSYLVQYVNKSVASSYPGVLVCLFALCLPKFCSQQKITNGREQR